MRRTPIALLCTAACAILAIPVSALATPEVGQKNNGYSICDEQAIRLYVHGMHRGLDLGRNRIEDGKLLKSGKVIPEPHPCQWRDYLDAQLHPVVESAPVASSGSGFVAPAPTPTSVPPSSGGCPASMAGESSLPTAVNASSGAAGCFQIVPSTWEAYGDPNYASADQAPMDVQTAAMQRICAAQGNDAWTAADPC
jgi:hypothetical protein